MDMIRRSSTIFVVPHIADNSKTQKVMTARCSAHCIVQDSAGDCGRYCWMSESLMSFVFPAGSKVTAGGHPLTESSSSFWRLEATAT